MIFLSVFPFKQTTVVLYTDYIFGWGFRSGFCKRKLSNLSSAIGECVSWHNLRGCGLIVTKASVLKKS